MPKSIRKPSGQVDPATGIRVQNVRASSTPIPKGASMNDPNLRRLIEDASHWEEHRHQQAVRAQRGRATRLDEQARADETLLKRVAALRVAHPEWGRRNIARHLLRGRRLSDDRLIKAVKALEQRIRRLDRRSPN
jgi:hypothetical protein